MKSESAALWQTIFAGLTFLTLLTTLVVLMFYTAYTHRMQQAVKDQVVKVTTQTEELIRQRRLSVLPSFTAYPHDPRSTNRIHLQNIGKGVAINIQIRPIHVPHDQYQNAVIILRPKSTLNPSEVTGHSLDFAGIGEGQEKHNAMNTQPIDDYVNRGTYEMVIEFNDIEGTAYTQTLNMCEGVCIPSPVGERVTT